jgi:hypothetical protein
VRGLSFWNPLYKAAMRSDDWKEEGVDVKMRSLASIGFAHRQALAK